MRLVSLRKLLESEEEKQKKCTQASASQAAGDMEPPEEELLNLLRRHGMLQYALSFKKNDVEMDIIGELTDTDLHEIGVSSLGHRRRLLKVFREREEGACATAGAGYGSRAGVPAETAGNLSYRLAALEDQVRELRGHAAVSGQKGEDRHRSGRDVQRRKRGRGAGEEVGSECKKG